MSEIRIDFTQITRLQAQLAAAPNVVQEELLALVTEADLLIEREVKDALPHASGLLAQSVFGEERVEGLGVQGFVGSALNYVQPVELGTRPHFPPIEPLMDWVKLKFGVSSDKEARGIAFLVARKIALRGTKGSFAFAETLARLEPAIEVMVARAQENIAQRIGAA